MKASMISLLILIAVSFPVSAQEAEGKESSEGIDSYEFPIRPGMPEWKTLKTHKEKLEALQIPDKMLADMSTEGLVHTCLNYPLWLDMMAFRNFQTGIENLITNFNGLQELMKRPDAGSVLLKVYKKMDPDAILQDWTSKQRGGWSFRFIYIELLLCQDQILSHLSNDKMCSLLKACLSNYKSKSEHETYGMLGVEMTALLISKVLLSEDYEPFIQKHEKNEGLKLFLRDEILIDTGILNEIVISAQQYLAEREGGKVK